MPPGTLHRAAATCSDKAAVQEGSLGPSLTQKSKNVSAGHQPSGLAFLSLPVSSGAPAFSQPWDTGHSTLSLRTQARATASSSTGLGTSARHI